MESAQGRSLTGEESVMGWSLTRGRSLTEESSDEGSGSDGVGVGRRGSQPGEESNQGREPTFQRLLCDLKGPVIGLLCLTFLFPEVGRPLGFPNLWCDRVTLGLKVPEKGHTHVIAPFSVLELL